MWRVIKRMYESSKSGVLLDGECSEAFDVEQEGVALRDVAYHQLCFPCLSMGC